MKVAVVSPEEPVVVMDLKAEAEAQKREVARVPESVALILRGVAVDYNVTIQEMMDDSKVARIAVARQEAFRRLYAYEPGGRRVYSLPRIGQIMGRHHATVLHGIRKAKERLENEGRFEPVEPTE